MPFDWAMSPRKPVTVDTRAEALPAASGRRKGWPLHSLPASAVANCSTTSRRTSFKTGEGHPPASAEICLGRWPSREGRAGRPVPDGVPSPRRGFRAARGRAILEVFGGPFIVDRQAGGLQERLQRVGECLELVVLDERKSRRRTSSMQRIGRLRRPDPSSARSSEILPVVASGSRRGPVVAYDLGERPKGDIAVLGGRGQGREQVRRGDVMAAGEGPDVGVVADPAVARAEFDGGAELLPQDDR